MRYKTKAPQQAINFHLICPNLYEPGSSLYKLYKGHVSAPQDALNPEPMSPLPSPLPVVEDLFTDIFSGQISRIQTLSAESDVEYNKAIQKDEKLFYCENGCNSELVIQQESPKRVKLLCQQCNTVVCHDYCANFDSEKPIDLGSMSDNDHPETQQIKREQLLCDVTHPEEESSPSEYEDNTVGMSIYSAGERGIVSDSDSDDEAFEEKCISRGIGFSQRRCLRMSRHSMGGIRKNARKMRGVVPRSLPDTNGNTGIEMIVPKAGLDLPILEVQPLDNPHTLIFRKSGLNW
mmetsp:Transcript_7409/g.27688  ORF Transcript_7409/g.27688 Transcript_7409/m.27688 type:complete len:291 (-) Transcript_7409:102-974(-)